jgi:hypothetical protein
MDIFRLLFKNISLRLAGNQKVHFSNIGSSIVMKNRVKVSSNKNSLNKNCSNKSSSNKNSSNKTSSNKSSLNISSSNKNSSNKNRFPIYVKLWDSVPKVACSLKPISPYLMARIFRKNLFRKQFDVGNDILMSPMQIHKFQLGPFM